MAQTAGPTHAPAIRRFLTHRESVGLTLIAMTMLYALMILVLLVILDDERLAPALVLFLGAMVFQYLNTALLLPDLDHQRIRLTLSYAPARIVDEVLKDSEEQAGRDLSRLRHVLQQVEDSHWSEVSKTLRAMSVVERNVSTTVRVVVGFAAVIIGALLGNWFAEAFRPLVVDPVTQRLLQVGVVMMVGIVILMVTQGLRIMWRQDVSFAEKAEGVALPLVDLYRSWRWTDRFSQKFFDDVELTVNLAGTPVGILRQMRDQIPDGAKRWKAWTIDNSTSTSLGLLQFGLGLILGAAFQVFI